MTSSRKQAPFIAATLGALALMLCGPAAPALAKTPLLTLTRPAPTGETTPTLHGTTTDAGEPVTVEIYRGPHVEEAELDQTLEVAGIEVTETWSATLAQALQPGVYTAVAEQQEGALASKAATFTIATTPEASIEPLPTPTNNATPELSGSAGTAAGDLEEVEVTVYEGGDASGTPRLTAAAAVSAGEWTYAVPHLADSTYTVTASQENEAGETQTSAPVTFTIDTVAPTLTISAPADNEALTTATPTYAGTAGGASGDRPSVSVTVYAGTSPAGTPVQTIELSAAQWTAGHAGPALSNGIYTAVADQSDEAGNLASAEVTFAVAASGSCCVRPPLGGPTPSFQWFPAHPLTGEAVTLVSTSTDVSSPITALAWALAQGAPFTAGTSVLTTSFAKAGSYTVGLRVTDAAGVTSIATGVISVSAPAATLMVPFPVVRIAGSDNRHGTRVALLTVEAPLGATVKVRCVGHGCPARRLSVRVVSHAGATGTTLLKFTRFERLLRPGAVLEVSVSKPSQIGKYTRLRVRRGKLPERVDECLGPDSKPLPCPA